MKQLLHDLKMQQNWHPHEFAKFCSDLSKSKKELDAEDAQKLLDLFCRIYWQLDTLQKSCYEDVCSILLNASRKAWIKIIPLLMKKSIVCNDLVFLAQILLEDFTAEERLALDKVYPFYWTDDDDWSSITEEEYAYRKTKGLDCWISKNPSAGGKITKDYRRPANVNDLKCFLAMLKVLGLTEQKIYFHVNGWFDD